MVNLLRDGSIGLDDIFKRAEQLGILFSRMDLAWVEKANDSWNDMKVAIGGLWKAIAIELSPAIIIFAKEMTNLVLSTREWGSTFGDVSKGIVRGFGVITEVAIIASAHFRLLAVSLEEIAASTAFLADPSGTAAQMKAIAKKYEDIARQVTKAMKGGYQADFLAKLEKLKQEMQNIQQQGQGDEEIAAGGTTPKPAALLRGTSEAAVAAAKAGANDRNTELFRQMVIKLNDVGRHTVDSATYLRVISEAMGYPAGIVPE